MRTLCGKIYITVHVWTSIWKNNNAKQLNSTTVYTEKSVYKKY